MSDVCRAYLVDLCSVRNGTAAKEMAGKFVGTHRTSVQRLQSTTSSARRARLRGPCCFAVLRFQNELEMSCMTGMSAGRCP